MQTLSGTFIVKLNVYSSRLLFLRHGKLDDSKRKQNFINLNFYSPPNELDECKLKGLLITTVTSNGQFVFVYFLK